MSVIETSTSDDIPEEIRSLTEKSDTDKLSKDMIFGLLMNRRRRQVLTYLLGTEGTVTLSDLAEHIAAWENDIEIRALNSAQRKRVYVGLYQTHLPKMDDAGVIDYNQDRGLITLGENADSLVLYLETETPPQDRWDQLYASMSVIGTALVGGVYLGLPGMSIVSVSVVSGLVVSAFLIVSLVHVFTTIRTNNVSRENSR